MEEKDLFIRYIESHGSKVKDVIYHYEDWYHYFNVFFCRVSNLYVSGLKIRKSTGWSFPLQTCNNVLIENIDFELQDNVQLNQDGVGVHYGSHEIIVRNIMGYTKDDFIPLLNTVTEVSTSPALDFSNYIMYHPGYSYRKIENIYYENILPYYNFSCVSRIVAFNDAEISNLKYRNIQVRSIDYYVIDFTDYSDGNTGNIHDVEIKNILVKNVSAYIDNVIHIKLDVYNITINDLLMKSGPYLYLVQIESGYDVTDVTINSRYVVSPTTGVLNDLGGTLTNFVNTNIREEATRYIIRMGTPPSAALNNLIRKTIADLIIGDIWNSMTHFVKTNIHNETDAKLNWKGDYYNVVPVGTPTYTAKKGWLCPTGKYLKSGLIPATLITAGNIGEDDCGILVELFETAGDYGTVKINGTFSTTATGGAAERFQLDTYSVGDTKCYGFLNCNVGGTINKNDDVASADGVFFLNRNANKMLGYYNGVNSSNVDVLTSNPTVNQEIYFGAYHTAVNTDNYSTNAYIRTMAITKYLGSVKQLALYNIIKYFNDNVGGTF